MSPTSHATPLPLNAPARWLLLALAILCVALALVGLVIPVLPSVPFLLAAAWAASRSSPRLDAWLHGHPRFGRLLRDWRDGGVVPRPAKWAATAMMTCSGAFLLLAVEPVWLALLALAAMVTFGGWLWRRPERR